MNFHHGTCSDARGLCGPCGLKIQHITLWLRCITVYFLFITGLTCEDEVSIPYPGAVRPDAEVYAPGVHVPLVGLGVVRGGRAAVVPQPDVVKTHRCPSIVELW